MGKVIALVLIALGAKVNAEVDLTKLTNILANRASNNTSYNAAARLDDTTLGKPVMMTGARVVTVPRGVVAVAAARDKNAVPLKGVRPPQKGSFNPFPQGPKGPSKIFGGTSSLMAGKGKAITEESASIAKDASFGWLGAIGGGRPAKEVANTAPKGKFTPFAQKQRGPSKIFGGTSSLMAGAGKAITQESASIPRGGSFGWFGAIGGAQERDDGKPENLKR